MIWTAALKLSFFKEVGQLDLPDNSEVLDSKGIRLAKPNGRWYELRALDGHDLRAAYSAVARMY